MNADILIEDAKSHWANALGKAGLGLDPTAFSLQVIKAIAAQDVERVVLRARSESQGEFIFKYEPNLAKSDRFANMLTAHRHAEACFDGEPDLHLAKLLWASEANGAQLIEFIRGQTAFERLDWSLDDPDLRYQTILECAGWLRCLHRAGAAALNEAPRKANLSWLARFAAHQAGLLRSGALDVGAPKMFLGLCAMMHRLVRQAEGVSMTRSYLHGDPHLGNFIHGRDGLYGIDLTDRGTGPVEVDAARMLTRVFYKFDNTEEGALDLGLAAPDWQAFSDGYGCDLRETPVMVVFIAQQILRDWSTIKRADLVKGSPRQRKFEKIKLIFKSLREAGY